MYSESYVIIDTFWLILIVVFILILIIVAHRRNTQYYQKRAMSRNVWLDHVWRTREYILAVAEKSKAKADTAAWLLKNQEDIGKFYGSDKLTNLLKQHISLAAQILENADQKIVVSKWYANSREISAFVQHNLGKNIYKHMKEHLDLTLREALQIMSGDYKSSVETFGAIKRSIIEMADLLI